MTKTILNLTIIILSIIITSFFVNYYVINDDLFFNTYSEVMTNERIRDMINFSSEYQWLSFIFIPIMIFFKTIMTSVIIYIALFFAEIKISFKNVFRVVVKAEYIFVFSLLLNSAVLFIKSDLRNLLDVQNYHILSLLSLFDYNVLPSWSIYPLKTLNIFEVMYVFAIGFFLSKELKMKPIKATEIIVIPYSLGLLSWIVFLVFLNVSYT